MCIEQYSTPNISTTFAAMAERESSSCGIESSQPPKSLRRLIVRSRFEALPALSCADEVRRLIAIGVSRKAARDTKSFTAAILKVPIGGRKKKLKQRAATIDVMIETARSPKNAERSTSIRNRKPTVGAFATLPI